MGTTRPYPEVQQGLKISLRKQKKSKEKHLPRNDTEEETHRFYLCVIILLFSSPGPLSSLRMRGSILCDLFLWIPAYAGMTGESLRNPSPELVKGDYLLSLTVAYTSGSERFVLFCIIVIQGKIVPKLFKLPSKQ